MKIETKCPTQCKQVSRYHLLVLSLIQSRPSQKTVWPTESIFLAVKAVDIM